MVCGDARQPLRGTDNPTSQGLQRFEKSKKVGNLKGVMSISRENDYVRDVFTLGRRG
jgi:hypothetical protein